MTEAEGIAELCEAFERRFARPPAVVASAPGRVNLIGEHTDYSEGLVLPCAIDRHTSVVAAPRSDTRVRVAALDLDAYAEFDAASPARRGDFVDYVQGVVHALAGVGVRVAGFDAAIASRVPIGAGLSSSAALGLAVMGAIDRMQGLDLAAEARARIVHRGESGFVGVGCGILDQFASALGRRDHALRIDCRSQHVEPVALAGERLAILIVHSGVARALAKAGYRDRVGECEAAVLAARRGGVGGRDARTLRDYREADLPALEQNLAPRLFRRARHVITENARVDAFSAAMGAGDHAALGRLLATAQASLRDDFEVSTAELDGLCEIAAQVPGVVGSRLTGAGFGGCTMHLVDPAHRESAAQAIGDGFHRRFGRRPASWVVHASDGAVAQTLDRGERGPAATP